MPGGSSRIVQTLSTAVGRSTISTLADVNLNRLAVFVAVVEAGSLSAAARRLGVATTLVSTHLQRLEQELGASLLLRTTRSLRLTDAGATFFEAARQIVADAETAIAAAAAATDEPRGTLRVTAPIDYSALVVAPIAVALQKRYPKLQIERLAGDRIFDLVADKIDVAIRIGQLADSAHRAARIGSFADCLIASPELFADHPWPAHPGDLAALPFIALSVLTRPLDWRFSAEGEMPQDIRFASSLSVNTAHALRSAAAAGGGLAILPDFIVGRDIAMGRLVRVLPQWRLPTGGIHALYPAARHPPQKTRVLIDALKAQAAANDTAEPLVIAAAAG